MKRLISYRNGKLMKSIDYGYLTGGLSLLPHTLADPKVNLCPYADGCQEKCLVHAGNGKFPNVYNGRKNNTLRYIADLDGFMSQVYSDLLFHERKAEKLGLKPAFRPNVFTDIRYEKRIIPETGKTIFESFPNIEFYDYTAFPQSIRPDRMFPNYKLVYSFKGSETERYKQYLRDGNNVAVVFANERTHWNRFRVVSGDNHDLVFLQPKGKVIGLTPKGIADTDLAGSIAQ